MLWKGLPVLVWEERALSFPGWTFVTKEFTLFHGQTKALSVHPRVSPLQLSFSTPPTMLQLSTKLLVNIILGR